MAGRKCTICFHKQQAAIDVAIARGDSLRGIAVEFGIKSTTNLERHIENHLGMRVGAIREQKEEQSRLNIENELQRMVGEIRRLDEAVEEYLSDPDDPLKFTIDPWAHETEVIYFDMNDTTGGENPKPKKKRAGLQLLLSMLQLGPAQEYDDEEARVLTWAHILEKDMVEPAEIFNYTWERAMKYFMRHRQSLDLEAEKVSIKHVDMRDWILKVKSEIRATLTKIGEIQGVFKAPEANDPYTKAISAIRTLMALHPGLSEKQAMEAILRQQRETNMQLIEPAVMQQVAKKNGILQLEGLVG